MQAIYLGSAIVGGGLLLLQMAMSLLGGEHDAGGDHELHAGDLEHESGGMGFSFRAVVAFLTFFGIGGMASLSAGLSTTSTLAIAVGCGSLAFWLIGLALRSFNKLRASGNVDIGNAVGAEAKVYLTVPAGGSGEGSITLTIQGRIQQFKALTKGRELKTGALCRVVAVRSSDTLEIESV
jgi:hypothetical protein